MAIPVKPQHLSRYRQLAGLFLKYGRGDVIRNGDVEGGPAGLNAAPPGMGSDRVHTEPGEILRGQRDVDEASVMGAPLPVAIAEQEGNSDARSFADDLEAMGPTFIKLGQFLSTRSDVLPAPYLESLARLQDNVEPFAFEEVERIVVEDLGARLSKAFDTFEEKPVAAASLGQVHRARLRNGNTVAVKVQRPGIRDRIVEDLEVLDTVTSVLDKRTDFGRRFGFGPVLEEFRAALLRELDYSREARNLTVLGRNLARFERIVVPSPVDDYVTSRVLTMEFIQGRKVTSLGPLARLEMDGAPLAEELCQAYLQQILVDGFFHADPHPGNIFLTDDGRLAFLDLGMVARMGPSMQEAMLKMVLAISEGRGEDAADLVLKMGTPVAETNAQEVRRRIGALVMESHGLRITEIALGRLLTDAVRAAAQDGYRMPRELTMLSKTLLNLDEVARRLDPAFDPNASIRRHAAEIMRQRMLKSLSPGRLFDGLLELNEFAGKLPRRLNALIDAISENRVRIHVDAFDEALLMEGLQKIANRITVGLVISAMTVGAALLMRVQTRFQILGYPALAILLFLGAALASIVLLSNILLHDLRAEKHKLLERQRKKKPEAPRAPA